MLSKVIAEKLGTLQYSIILFNLTTYLIGTYKEIDLYASKMEPNMKFHVQLSFISAYGYII